MKKGDYGSLAKKGNQGYLVRKGDQGSLMCGEHQGLGDASDQGLDDAYCRMAGAQPSNNR